MTDTTTSISAHGTIARTFRLAGPIKWTALSALLMWASFPPMDMGWLAWFALVPFLYGIQEVRRARSAFAMGWLFGFLHWGALVTWIGTAVTEWVHSPLGWGAWFGLTAIKSCWFGLFGLAAWRISAETTVWKRNISLAAAWTMMDWLRCQTALAMPWCLLGYSQYRFLPLIQIAEITGVFGLSFAIAYVNSCLMSAADAWKRIKSVQAICVALVPGLVCLGSLVLYGTFSLRANYHGPPIRLAMVQTNERSYRDLSDQDGAATENLRLINRFASNLDEHKVDLVIWPESAANRSAFQDDQTRAAFERIAKKTDAWQLVGCGKEDANGGIYNTAALFSSSGGNIGEYVKHWLVPFGEWTPMRDHIPFQDFFKFPKNNTPGPFDSTLSAGSANLDVLICYESVFPALTRRRVALGANLLVNMTNDSWSGESPELLQHSAMATFRAVETRRYLASAGTTGITALVDPHGRRNTFPPYREGVHFANAELISSLPPYVRFGDWFVGLCAVWLIGIGAAMRRIKPVAAKPSDQNR